MKYILVIVLVAFVATTTRLAYKQARLEHSLRTVQAENQRLADEVAQKAMALPEEFRAVQTRLEQAHVFMAAVENRLTNATAILGSLREAAATHKQSTMTHRLGGANARVSDVTPNAPDFLPVPDDGEPAFSPISSSHSPDGQLQQRPWGPEQVVGPANTDQAGDIETAWAPLLSNGVGEEWLRVNYDRPVEISEINVRETYNPGAISMITATALPNGEEVVVWEGTEPPAQAPVNMNFTGPSGVHAQSVTVYLDRRRVPGWNEIDAIELVGRDGSRQWASSATASSSYAERPQRISRAIPVSP